jgi:hypothetical protein
MSAAVPKETQKQYLRVSNAPPVYKSVDELNAYFGEFGGCFVAETLIKAHHDLIDEYVKATQDPKFRVRLYLYICTAVCLMGDYVNALCFFCCLYLYRKSWSNSAAITLVVRRPCTTPSA